ncbi:uncharacterized protein [Dermacentor albipictus]|uniref:uncharacterized protein n=1 Tax=Dermacentor albipictus TaxID=60249 RepID=UPI0038FC213A
MQRIGGSSHWRGVCLRPTEKNTLLRDSELSHVLVEVLNSACASMSSPPVPYQPHREPRRYGGKPEEDVHAWLTHYKTDLQVDFGGSKPGNADEWFFTNGCHIRSTRSDPSAKGDG